MKKLFTTFAIVLTLGFVTLQVADAATGRGGIWNCGGPGGRFVNSAESGYCLGPDGYYEGAEKSFSRGERGYRHGWMMSTEDHGGRGYRHGWMMGAL